jgi:surface protein
MGCFQRQNMWMMFFGASAFNQDLSAWDVSSIATMDLMCNGTSSAFH